MRNVMLLAGAGQIGMAIARRMGTGMKIVVGDKKIENARSIAETMNEAGFDAVPVEMDLSNRESIRAMIAEGQKHGVIRMLVNAAGVFPSQAPIEAILKVDLYGTAVLLFAGGIGQGYRARRRGRDHFQPARLAHARPDGDAGCAAGNCPHGRTVETGFPAAGEYSRHASRLPAGEALQ